MPKCARPGCANPIRPGWYACKPDWYQLPREIRHAIFSAWNAGDFLRNPDYHAAVKRARQWWDKD